MGTGVTSGNAVGHHDRAVRDPVAGERWRGLAAAPRTQVVCAVGTARIGTGTVIGFVPRVWAGSRISLLCEEKASDRCVAGRHAVAFAHRR
jgi:hypothetical protein